MHTKKLRDFRHGLSPRARMRLIRQALGELNDSLEKLGFDDYDSYLESNLWHKIRRRIFGRAKGKCEGCGERPPENIHHWSYSVATLQGQRPQHLEAVCRACHLQFHQEVPEVAAAKSAKAAAKAAYRALVQAGGVIAQPRDMTPRLVKAAR